MLRIPKTGDKVRMHTDAVARHALDDMHKKQLRRMRGTVIEVQPVFNRFETPKYLVDVRWADGRINMRFLVTHRDPKLIPVDGAYVLL